MLYKKDEMIDKGEIKWYIPKIFGHPTPYYTYPEFYTTSTKQCVRRLTGSVDPDQMQKSTVADLDLHFCLGLSQQI